MTNSQRLAAVRQRLQQWLREHCRSSTVDSETAADRNVVGSDNQNLSENDSAEPVIYGESILIREGFYCGRKFDAGPFQAVWFIEEDELKIYAEDGKWVCSLNTSELTSTAIGIDDASSVKSDTPSLIQMSENGSHAPGAPAMTQETDTSDNAPHVSVDEVRRAA